MVKIKWWVGWGFLCSSSSLTGGWAVLMMHPVWCREHRFVFLDLGFSTHWDVTPGKVT